jgi:uncharacterized coiled-coil DUF342 family protein
MTASANAGADGGSVELQWPSSEEEIQSLKRLLQEQRRRATVLNADIQREIEAREAVQGQLIEAHAEIAASRDRRKEMARVITNREGKIARLNGELQARYEELAAMQRLVVQSSVKGRIKRLVGRIRRKRS